MTRGSLHHNLTRKRERFPAAWQSKDLISECKSLDDVKKGPCTLAKLALGEKDTSCLVGNLKQQILYYLAFWGYQRYQVTATQAHQLLTRQIAH